MEIKSLKEQYIKLMADKISISIEDLSQTEKELIDFGYELFSEKMEDIKILNDELRRVSVDLANMKSYRDDIQRDKWNDDYDDDFLD
ncbi:MAG: hypothetical protein ACK5OW_00345 [bacterium]|jgi:hypothetical protein